jgi:L-amino acid N-acyltransferase YncA
MLIRFLKPSEHVYKNWIINAFTEIRKIEKVTLTKNEKNEISKDLDWAMDENNTWHNVLICEKNENIIGYCWYIKQTMYPCGGYSYGNLSKPYIWVHSIYTEPNMARKGVATLLYSKLEEIAKQENVEKMYLDIYQTNVISEKFHCKQGFEKEIMIYSKKI